MASLSCDWLWKFHYFNDYRSQLNLSFNLTDLLLLSVIQFLTGCKLSANFAFEFAKFETRDLFEGVESSCNIFFMAMCEITTVESHVIFTV